MKQTIPVYDICSISTGHKQEDLLAERMSHYLKKNYQRVHQQHGHSFYHMVFFTEGSGSQTIDFSRYAVSPNQLYFMVPGQVHSWHFNPGVEGYVIHFSESFFRTFLLDHDYLDRFTFFNGNSKDQVMIVPPAARRELTALLEKILDETAQQDTDMVRALLLQLFLLVDKCCGKDGSKIIPQQKQLVLRNFQQLINKHFRSIKLPKEYAELLYITPNHLNALCQDLLGKTAGELIRDRILLEAKRMLTNAGMTVTQIARELNFEDNSYFSRFFKKYEGMTPDEFRKNLN